MQLRKKKHGIGLDYGVKRHFQQYVTAKPGIRSNVVEMVPYPLYFALYTYDAGLTKGF